MNKNGMFWGLILVIGGGCLLLNNLFDLDLFSMKRLWPIFILVPGLIFELSYFTNRNNPGVLVPGGILTVIGLLFFFETLTGWRLAGYTWPVYPLAVAFGLFQLYLASGRNKGSLIPVLILTAVAVIAWVSMLAHTVLRWVDLGLVIPALLVLAGLFILLRGSGPKE